MLLPSSINIHHPAEAAVQDAHRTACLFVRDVFLFVTGMWRDTCSALRLHLWPVSRGARGQETVLVILHHQPFRSWSLQHQVRQRLLLGHLISDAGKIALSCLLCRLTQQLTNSIPLCAGRDGWISALETQTAQA